MPSAETQTETPPRDNELHKKMDEFANRFNNVEKVSEEYKTSFQFTQEEVQGLQEENTALKSILEELSLEIKRNSFAIQKLDSKQERMETDSRKKNLIFEGVPEQQGVRENLQEGICQIFSEMEIERQISYDAVYRVGQRPGKYPRPLFVSFVRLDDRNLIFANRSHLRNSQHFT